MATHTVNNIKIQIRRDVAQNWTTENPTLAAGEFGYETDTGKIKIGDGSTTWNSLAYYDGKLVQKSSSRSIEFIKTTNTAADAALTGVTEDASLYDGKTIFLYLSYAAASNATLNLTLSGGTTTGAKPVYYTGTTRMGNTYRAGSVVSLTYVQAKDAWCRADYTVSNTNNYDRRLHNNNISAASAITKNKIIVGDKNGYKNLAAGVTFDISYPILWASAAIAVGTPQATAYECYPGVSLQDTVANWTGTQWSMVYLVGTLSGTIFTVDNSVFTTTVPSTADGKVYIPIGILYSTYQLFFAPTKEMYQYTNGSFHLLDTTTAETGDTNGTIKINGSEVAVKGLATGAYAAAYSHPTSAGNKHIPSGGSSNQYLKYSAAGTAAWASLGATNNADGVTYKGSGTGTRPSSWWHIKYASGLEIETGNIPDITTTEMTVTYGHAFASTPRVIVVPHARVKFSVGSESQTSFKVRSDNESAYDFRYIAVAITTS